MRNLLIIVLCFLVTIRVNAQGVNADCINAINLCNTPSFTFYATSGAGTITDFSSQNHGISNPINNPFPPNAGCLKSGELNPQWLLLTIGNTGTLEFVFGAKNSAHPQAGCYDWSMWAYNDSTCQKIFNNTQPPIRCNWNGPCQNGTGIASKSRVISMQWDSANFEAPLPVNACDRYIICISNFSGANTLVSFESVGTASIRCTPGNDQAICYGQSATIMPMNCTGLTNVSYSLEPGSLTSTTGTFVVTPQATTNYTSYLTGNNPANNNAVETVSVVNTITVFQQPSVAPTVTNTTCNDTLNGFDLNLTLLPPLSNPQYTVLYSPVPAGVTSGTNQIISTPSVPVAPGNYSATVITEGGCSVTGTFAIAPLPARPVFALTPATSVHSVTCYQPTVTVTATQPSYNYTWTNGLIAQQTGSVANISSTGIGTWTVYAEHPVSKCIESMTMHVGQNTTLPVSAITPTYQSITCSVSASVVTISAISPTVNFTQMVLSPLGGSFVVNTSTASYQPGTVGTFSHVLINNVNGCRATREFTVTSSDGFPTFDLTSTRSFTLGCNDRSWADINIQNAQAAPGIPGSVSYTLLPPSGSTVTQSGTLSAMAAYTVGQPGTYTVVTRNNTNSCDTRIAVTVLSNTLAPSIDTMLVPSHMLTCFIPSVTLRGISVTPNVSYQWMLPGNLTQSGDELISSANFSARTETVRATYTFEVKDQSSTCTNSITVTMLQNLFTPLADISGELPLSCKVDNVLLTNSSMPDPANPHPKSQPVAAILWEGPSPQVPMQNSTSYLAYYPGTYSMTVRDLNNGCTALATATIVENRDFPILNNPIDPGPGVLDCGAQFGKLAPIVAGDKSEITFEWSGPPGFVSLGQSRLEDTLRPDRTGEYRVVATNIVSGCASSVKMDLISGTLTASIDASLESDFAPTEAVFHNTSSSTLGSDSILAVWSFGNGMDTILNTVSSVYTNYTQPGSYTVALYVRKGICVDTAFKVLHVEIPSALEIPNVFTPNNDGVNDEFFLHVANLSNIEVLVVDRWGNKVYEVSSSTGNILWDGKTQSGRDAPDGTYLYMIKATGKDGTLYDQKGTISLIR